MARDSFSSKMWENIIKKRFFVGGLVVLLFLPFILDYNFLPRIPVISDLYAILHDIGLFGGKNYIIQILMLAMIMAILAASWDLLSGYTGQFNFGHAIFLGFSAYVGFMFMQASLLRETNVELFPLTKDLLNFILEIPIIGGTLQSEPIIAIFWGALFSAFLALILGVISLRLKGSYFSLITLISPIILAEAIRSIDLFPGKNFGIPNIPKVVGQTKVAADGYHYFNLLYYVIILFLAISIVSLIFYSGVSDKLKYMLREKGNDFTQNSIISFLYLISVLSLTFVFSFLLIDLDLLGLYNIDIVFGGFTHDNREIYLVNSYIFILIMFILIVGVILIIAYSRLGDIFQSIREDEEASESLGINLTKYKILAFALSAFFAGLAGGLYSQYLNFIGPSFFEATISIQIIIMCIIGGVGTIYGGVLGAFIVIILVELFLKDVFHSITGMEVFVLGAFLIIILVYLEHGIVRAKNDEKKAMFIGILLALSWSMLSNIDIFAFPDAVIQLTVLILSILTIPVVPVFIVAEEIGLFIFKTIMSLNLTNSGDLMRAKFLIYVTVGIPYAYLLPRIFKKARIKFWGIWPSVGIYEPDN